MIRSVNRHDLRDRLISLIGHLGHALPGRNPQASLCKAKTAGVAKKTAVKAKAKSPAAKRVPPPPCCQNKINGYQKEVGLFPIRLPLFGVKLRRRSCEGNFDYLYALRNQGSSFGIERMELLLGNLDQIFFFSSYPCCRN